MENSEAKRLRELEQENMRLSRPLPRTIVCDNRPEFTSKAMFFWAKKAGLRLHFIQPGKHTQNAFVESFNGKCHGYCLSLSLSWLPAWRTRGPPATLGETITTTPGHTVH